MADIQDQDNRKGDVGCDEVAAVEIEEDGVTVGEGDQTKEKDAEIGANYLEFRSERDSVVEVVIVDGFSKPEVDDTNENPGDEPGHSGDVGQPCENDRRAVGDVQVGHQADQACDGNRKVRNTVPVGSPEDSWNLALDSHGVEHSSCREKLRVTTGVRGG